MQGPRSVQSKAQVELGFARCRPSLAEVVKAQASWGRKPQKRPHRGTRRGRARHKGRGAGRTRSGTQTAKREAGRSRRRASHTYRGASGDALTTRDVAETPGTRRRPGRGRPTGPGTAGQPEGPQGPTPSTPSNELAENQDWTSSAEFARPNSAPHCRKSDIFGKLRGV